jgi:hypothetical protein
MRKERIRELSANPDFISGIYNYCDRWCERCAFTSRCMNFALSEEQFSEPESRDIRNELFWQKLSEAFRLTHELLEDTLKEHNIDLNALAREAAEEQERAKHEEAENHACSLASRQYGKMLDEWFEAHGEFADKLRRPSGKNALSEGSANLKDSIEILRWYQHQIYAKIMRAVSGQIDERSWNSHDESPKDSDGSAKVALIGIDRSIWAWMALRESLLEQKDESIDFLVHLDRLRKNVEQHFPEARAFIRPGFDEVNSR